MLVKSLLQHPPHPPKPPTPPTKLKVKMSFHTSVNIQICTNNSVMNINDLDISNTNIKSRTLFN